MKVAVLAVAVVASSFSGQAYAAEREAEAKKRERVICRTTMATGSRFEKRQCKTAAEWEEMAEKHKEGWQEVLSKPTINPAEKP